MGRALVSASRSKKKTKQKVVKSAARKEDNVRLSKRNRQQAFPYQSPESIIKITQQFSLPTQEPLPLAPHNVRNSSSSSGLKTKPKPKVNVKVKDVIPSGRAKTALKKAKAPVQQQKGSKKSVKKTLKNSQPVQEQQLPRKRKAEQEPKITPTKKPKLVRTTEKAQASKEIAQVAAVTEDTKKNNVKRPRKPKDPSPKGPKVPTITKEKEALGKKRRTKNQLEPKPNVTKYEKDPTYESKLDIPPISSLANSRLLIRAVLLKDNKLLKSLLSKKKFIYSVAAPRNLDPQGETAVSCAIKTGNVEAIKVLMDSKNDDNMTDSPDVLLERESTGHGSNRMFGHAMRAVSIGRGGKEGNAAFLKDPQVTRGVPHYYNIAPHILSTGFPFDSIEKINNHLKGLLARCCENVVIALRAGQRDLAGQLVKWGNKCGGYGFNQLHEDVLVKQTEPLGPFKSVSVVKKDFHARITPLHCAAINPNVQYLAALLDVNPAVSTTDRENWTVLHYAAVCECDGPLDHILSEGTAVVTNIVNKDGDTPLHLACKLGRLANVQRILNHEKHRPADETMDVEETNKKPNRFAATSSLVRVNKIGLTPFQLAAKSGHVDVLELLLSQDTVDVNKPTAAAYDRVTPLMLAAANGHLNLVQFLAENRDKFGLKLDQIDKRGRTALTHAVMNGSGHVVSYLLRLGVNHLVADSSGNTLMHYAAAYGWYFNCKLLIEAGCPLDGTNDWKVTPLAVAFMKGHMGLVHMFLQLPGADINAVVNATNGRNLLLEVCNSKPSESTMEKLKFLVTEQQAKVNVIDHEKNNPLHTIVASYKRYYYTNLYRTDDDDEDDLSNNAENHKWTVAGIKLLIDANCDIHAINECNTSPITLAAKQGSFKLLLDAFRNISLPEESDEKGFNILHHVAMSSHTAGVQELVNQFITKPSNLLLARELAQKTNEDGMTPLFLLLTSLGGQMNKKELERGLWFLSFLLEKLNSDVNSGIMDEKKRQFVLHMSVKSHHAEELLPLILAKKPQLDVVNHQGHTPLLLAVLEKKEEASKLLIAAGSDVNFSNEQHPSILLACAHSSNSFALLPILIEKGADISKTNEKTGDSALHIVASKPTAPFALESVHLLLKKGHPACSVNKDGRTALHLLVNSRGGDIDVIYDLEMALIQAGPKALSMKDLQGRVPLHYVFTKIGKKSSRSFMDPIELMALIVRAMKDQGCWAGEDFKDNLKATPLHYGACVGATICTSLLLKDKPHWIDLPDQDSNTPFGLAVLYGHEGSALCMQQMNGNFTTALDTGRDAKHAHQTSTDPTPLKWQPRVLEAEQEQKLRAKDQVVTILEQVVQKDWQGILHLMGESLRSSGESIAPVIQAAIKTSRLKLAAKLLKQVTLAKDLQVSPKDGTLVHILARHSGPAAEELVQTLIAKGVDITRGNEFNSNALIQASVHRNLGLFKPMLDHLSSTSRGHILGRSDGFARTLFTSLFWGQWPPDPFESVQVDMVKMLRGLDKEDTLTHFPIKFLPMPSTRFLRLTVPTLADCQSDNKLSPLIMSVISGHYGMVKFLLTFDSKHKIDVNLQDGKGRTAIMHAVRLNDIKMVKLLLLGTNYDPSKDKIPWDPSEIKSLVTKRAQSLSKNRLNLALRDHEGLTVIDHLIRPSKWPFTYANSDAILQLLLAAKAPLDPSNLNRATSHRIRHLVKAIESHQGKKTEDIPISEEYLEFRPVSTALPAPIPNYLQDSTELAKKLSKNDKEKFCSVPDPLIGDVEQLQVVIENNQPFDCVITKVDVTYGIYGMYNFYKMQLLVHQATGLVLLFTRWGRVGDDGQYQKTPFGTLDEGKVEFKKIFMSKSGNSWDNLEGFSPMPKKYRLVKKDLRNRAGANEVKVDFEALKSAGKSVKSKLPKAVEDLVGRLCLSHEDRPSIYDRGVTIDQLPFGLLTPQALQNGETLLHQIEELIDKMEKLKDTPEYSKDQEQEIYNEIVDLSQEYYLTIPVYGFKSERLSPMFCKEDVQAKQRLIQKVLHIDFASQVLLGAVYNCQGTNPFDYVYSCLNVDIKLVEPDSIEAQLILQAVDKTCDGDDNESSKPKVFNIFRVSRPGESERVDGTGIRNRHLLWHGTSDVNLLSILTKGLQVAPHEAQINGHLFGKGIYFADMFQKSQHYCHGGAYKYMFLCDVALGKIHPVTCPLYDEKPGKSPGAFDSVKTADSLYEPDPGGAIVWQNRVMHLGEQVEQIFKPDRYHGLDYNEYVVFKPEQVSIKYMVQFKD